MPILAVISDVSPRTQARADRINAQIDEDRRVANMLDQDSRAAVAKGRLEMKEDDYLPVSVVLDAQKKRFEEEEEEERRAKNKKRGNGPVIYDFDS